MQLAASTNGSVEGPVGSVEERRGSGSLEREEYQYLMSHDPLFRGYFFTNLSCKRNFAHLGTRAMYR